MGDKFLAITKRCLEVGGYVRRWEDAAGSYRKKFFGGSCCGYHNRLLRLLRGRIAKKSQKINLTCPFLSGFLEKDAVNAICAPMQTFGFRNCCYHSPSWMLSGRAASVRRAGQSVPREACAKRYLIRAAFRNDTRMIRRWKVPLEG